MSSLSMLSKMYYYIRDGILKPPNMLPGRYGNLIPTRFLALIEGSKITAPDADSFGFSSSLRKAEA